jgi:hypothetical protein
MSKHADPRIDEDDVAAAVASGEAQAILADYVRARTARCD